MTYVPIGRILVIGAIVLLFVWPGWVFGHPIWGPWTGVGTNPPIPTPTATSMSNTATPGPAAQPSATSTVPAAVSTTLTVTPTTAAPATTTPPSGGTVAIPACTFSQPGDINGMPKTKIELVQMNTWFHRVFNERLFHAPDWGGADSWLASLNVGSNSGGAWTSFANPGQIVYRATSTNVSWCLGVSTTSKWTDPSTGKNVDLKGQFLAGAGNMPVAINVRVTPNTTVAVTTKSGKVINQSTSDAGDITIILPDDGVVGLATSFSTAAPTFESMLHWGPYDRSKDINTIDAR